MRVPIYQVDAFTNRRFAGNPAAVMVFPDFPDDTVMQSIAAENNLAETAFLVPAGGGYRLRWFTPAVEVDLCGHATLASAHVLWEDGHLKPGTQARFHTLSGLLTASQRDDGWIELDFPAEPAAIDDPPAELVRALDVTPVYAGRNRMDYLIEVPSEEIVRGLHPDMTLLRAVEMRGVIVTSRSDSQRFDFVSRFFAPAVGIDEDPVTGSAHCCLAPFWAERLGSDSLTGYQASARGGEVRVTLKGDRVLIAGQAVTVLRGELV
jgi:PhzF family phenazine biosynthesis protein